MQIVKKSMQSYARLIKLLSLPARYFQRLFHLKPKDISYFAKNDLIELKTGEEGRIVMVGREARSNKIKGYLVLWKFTYKGEKISFLDAYTKGVRKLN